MPPCRPSVRNSASEASLKMGSVKATWLLPWSGPTAESHETVPLVELLDGVVAQQPV